MRHTARIRPRASHVLAAFLALVMGTVAIASASASFRGSPGRIAFDDGRTFPSKIGSMNSDGSDVRILTERGDHWPRWSPDGSRLVFFSHREPDGTDDADAEIFVMSATGAEQTQLTFNEVEDQVPMWTADGRIVWSRRSGPGQWDIWMMNPDGSGQRRVTSFDGAELWPSPSPQGGRIAFSSNHGDGLFRIFVFRLDKNEVRQITSGALEDWAPDWSPTGNDIVFTRETPAPGTAAGVDEDVYIVHADGTNLRQVTDEPDRSEIFPTWSPDGKEIVYPAIWDWFGPNWYSEVTVKDLRSGVERRIGEPNIGGAPHWQSLPRP